MSEPIPLEDLLDALADVGIPIGPQDRIAVGVLLARYDGTKRTVLRDAIASLLASNADELALIRDRFDEVYPDAPVEIKAPERSEQEEPPPPTRPPSAPPPPPTPPERAPLRALGLAAGGAITLGALGTTAYFGWRKYAEKPIELLSIPLPTPPRQAKCGDDHAPLTLPPPTTLPASTCPQNPAISQWPMPVMVVAAMVLVALFVASLVRGALRAGTKRDLAWAKEFAALKGKRYYQPRIDGQSLSRSLTNEMVTRIADAIRRSRQSKDIDEERTASQTAEAAGVPVLKKLRRRRVERLVVLIDEGQTSRPFARIFGEVLHALRRYGLRVDAYFFDGNPLRIANQPHGQRIPLASLGQSHGGLPLMVLSVGDALARLEDTPAHPQRSAFERAISAFPRRVCLSPMEDVSQWPEGVSDSSTLLPTFPLTTLGVRRAAARLEGKTAKNKPRIPTRWPSAAPVRAQDVDLLMAMLALSPWPSYELAEALRARYLPHAPMEILLDIRGAVEEPRSLSTKKRIEESLARFRGGSEQSPTEWELRQFFLEILEHSRPEPGSAAEKRWMLDQAYQQLFGDEALAATALRTLDELSAGPLGDELQSRCAKDAQQRSSMPHPWKQKGFSSRLSWRGLRPSLSGRDALGILGAAAACLAALGIAGELSPAPLALDGRAQTLFGQNDVQAAICSLGGIYDWVENGQTGESLILGAPSSEDRRGLIVLQMRRGAVFGAVRGYADPAVIPSATAPDAEGYAKSAAGFGWVDALDRGQTAFRVQLRAETSDKACLQSRGWTLFYAIANQTLVRTQEEPNPAAVSGLRDRLAANAGGVAVEQCEHAQGLLPATGDELLSRLFGKAPRADCPSLKDAMSAQPCPAETPDRCGEACVSLREDPRHCGKCGQVCESGRCAEGVCQPKAPPPKICEKDQTLCGDQCFDLATHIDHCGSCTTQCYRDEHTQPYCERGECKIRCLEGYDDCDSVRTNGCETHLKSFDSACGDCRKRCASTETCVNGKCIVKKAPGGMMGANPDAKGVAAPKNPNRADDYD